MEVVRERLFSVSDSPEMLGDSPPEPMQEQYEPAPESMAQAEETQVEETHNKPKRNKTNNPYKDRISRLINDNRTKEHMNMQLQAELAEKERLLHQREEEIRAREVNNYQLFENNLRQEENSIVQNLKLSKESGDIDTEVELQRDLARVKSEQAAFDVLKYQNYSPPQNAYDDDYTSIYPTVTPYDYYDAGYENEPEVSEEYATFVERNPWVNPNAREYSPQLYQEANALAEDMNKRLKFNKQADLIGSDEYYQAIESAMNQAYAMKQRHQPQQQVQQSHSYPTGGVTRQGASLADQYISRSNPSYNNPAASLSAEEYQLARNLIVPSTGGGNLSSNQAIDLYTKFKQHFDKQPPHQTYRVTVGN
jgi:hypothetical protein